MKIQIDTWTGITPQLRPITADHVRSHTSHRGRGGWRLYQTSFRVIIATFPHPLDGSLPQGYPYLYVTGKDDDFLSTERT